MGPPRWSRSTTTATTPTWASTSGSRPRSRGFWPPGCRPSTEPSREDLLDAVGRLAESAAANLKMLLVPSARLSLPSATLDDAGLPPARDGSVAPTVLRALVLGEVAELVLVPHVDGDGLAWPPSAASDVLEPQT